MEGAEYLQCGICFEPYTTGSRLPKFLQCGGGIQHTYCLQCLRRLVVGGMIKCPSCSDLTSVPSDSADSLKNNIYLLPQIEAAAAANLSAKTRNGVEMFCKTCSAVATEKCGEHDLLKMSELRDALRQLAQEGAETMDTVKQRRAEVVDLFREAYNVLASVTESVRHTIDAYQMDVQLDDSIVNELDRKREAAETLPLDQLVDSYRSTEHDVLDATATLQDTSALAEQCRELLVTSISLSTDRGGLDQCFLVGDRLRSGHLMNALLAAGVVVFSLDRATSAGAEGTSIDQLTGTCGQSRTSDAAQSTTVSKLTNTAVNTSSKVLTDGTNGVTHSKSSSKSHNVDACVKSSNSVAGKPVTKTSITVPSSNGAALSSAVKKTATEKTNVPGKSKASAPVKSDPSTAAASTATTASKPKATPSFSMMVKSSAPAAAEPAPRSVSRPPRGVRPLYSLRVTDGTKTTDIVIELRPDMAPIMCKNFVMLCDGGLFDNTQFHFVVASDYLLGGRVDADEGYSPLATGDEKFVVADQCPLQDECGAIRMKGMGTVTGPGGEKRGLIGSQFMMWVSETREYRQYHYTLVFGYIRQGVDFLRAISNMDRAAVRRSVRVLSTKPHQH